jgi:hypothetical protein
MSIGNEDNFANEGSAKSVGVDERVGVTAFGKGRAIERGILRTRRHGRKPVMQRILSKLDIELEVKGSQIEIPLT